MSNHYEFLGEDSMDILTVAFAYDDAQRATARTAKGWSKSARTLGQAGTWTGDAAMAARSDAGKVGGILTETDRALKSSHNALLTYADTLSTLYSQVWDLNDKYNKQQALIDEGYDQLQALHGQQDRGTPAQQTSADNRADAVHADIAKAQQAIDHLDELYTQYKTKQSHAARTCATALTTLPGKKGVTFGGKQSLTALTGALGVGQLDVADLVAATKISKSLLDAKQPIDYTDPAVVKQIKELDALLAGHSKDPNFTTGYLRTIGQHDLLQLTGDLATMYSPDQAAWHSGVHKIPDIMQTVGDIQKQLGTSLATATQHIGQYGPYTTDGLDQTWLDELKKQGRTKFDFDLGVNGHHLNQDTKSVYGYVPLTVLMGDSAAPFNATVLQQVGDDLHSMEDNASDRFDSNHSLTWVPTGTSGIMTGAPMFNWDNPSGRDFNNGADPFNNWDAAMQNSPSAARHVLADDNTLDNYLLNHRHWNLYTGPQSDNPAGYYVVNPNDQQPSLIRFGSMLDHTIQYGSADPTSARAFANVMRDLGTSDHDGIGNPRISDSAGIASGDDWIPGELRPFVGDLATRNIDIVHNVFAGLEPSSDNPGELSKNDLQSVERVLTDLGKDEQVAGQLRHAEYNQYGNVVGYQVDHGVHSIVGNPTAAAADINACLDYAKNQGHIADVTAADEAHNAMVDSIVDSSASFIGGPEGKLAGPLFDIGKDALLGQLKDALHQDNVPPALAAAADNSGQQITALQDQYTNTVLNHAPNSVLTSAGLPYTRDLDYGSLTTHQQHIVDRWAQSIYGTGWDNRATDSRGAYETEYSALANLWKQSH